jgi:hypothetical protein
MSDSGEDVEIQVVKRHRMRYRVAIDRRLLDHGLVEEMIQRLRTTDRDSGQSSKY